jgi:hypothetical protein
VARWPLTGAPPTGTASVTADGGNEQGRSLISKMLLIGIDALARQVSITTVDLPGDQSLRVL